MLDENDDVEHLSSVAAVTAKVATQSTLLAGLDPVDHERPDVKRLRESTLANKSAVGSPDEIPPSKP